ncbi:efflux RND transporter periplasmic adaptor subunit [Hyphomicrobium sp. 99]|uniref:efflux RND transporter periplasmic adaptor subunit n=1 Tax=Hyphomicrobium sp. 99 TaxID=1163419 RepID=UPI0005F7C809|nr:efflux RND transporter periplasmic adaptor subunit [Hyphomicrobium sp. 99]
MTRVRIAKALFLMPFVALAGCGEQNVGTPKAPPLVRTQVVAFTDYAPNVVLTGEIKARVQTGLSFRVSGRISERLVDVGARVTPDQVLARIDPKEQNADVVSAEATVQSAEARVRQTATAFERQKALIKDGFTTRRDYDQAEEALRTAEGSLEAANAQLGTARDALSYTELRAGAAGVITARTAEVGQVAQAAQTMFTLAQDGPRDAVFYVYEAIFLQQLSASTITLALASDPSITATGVVREVSPSVDTKSGTIRVKIEINDPPPGFTLGALVSGAARMKARQVVILPWTALSTLAGKPAVWVVDPKSSVVSLKAVEVAAYQTKNVVIESGLEPGERVVTAGAKILRPNQIIALAPEAG